MLAKKINSDTDLIEAASELNTDEELIESNVRTIRKNKRQPPAAPNPEPETDDDDFIEAEIYPEPDVFDEGSLGSLLNRTDDEEMRTAQCNILVVRKPDSAGDKFVKPCTGRMSEQPIRNIELTTPQLEIEEMVRTYYGGGHYYLQIQLSGRTQTGWNCDLADPPEAAAKARAAQFAAENPYHQPAPAPAASAVDPFAAKIEQMELERRYDELRFGPERQRAKEIEDERNRLRDKVSELERQSVLSGEMQLLNFAKSTGNETLMEKAIASVLDKPESEPSHWLVELVKTGFEHREEIAGIAQTVLGGMMPQPAPNGIEALLRQPPPAPADAGHSTAIATFRRRPVQVGDEPNHNMPEGESPNVDKPSVETSTETNNE